MQLQRQSIRVVEESHLLAGVIIHADWLAFNSYLRQLPHRLLYAVYIESKVTQTTGFRAVHTLRRVFLSENLQLCVFIDTKIQLPVLSLRTVVFSDDRETSVYKGYKQDKIEMRGDRAEMSDFPLYLNTVAGGLDRRDQTIGGFSFVVKIYAVPVVEIIG